MKKNIYEPCEELKYIINQYFIIASILDIEKLLFLPNGGNFLIFNKETKCYTEHSTHETYEVPQGFSASLKRNKAKKIVIENGANINALKYPIILVELTPIGFYKLFHTDASILHDDYMQIDEQIITKYFSEIYSHASMEDEVAYIDNALKNLEAANNNTRLLIEDIMESIASKHYYEVTVKELMDEFQCTRKTIERHFKKYIGLTPKNFIYILKFCKTFLEYVQDTKSLKDTISLYSDNAHFNVVFQNITGYTPSKLFNAVNNHEIEIYQIEHYNLA